MINSIKKCIVYLICLIFISTIFCTTITAESPTEVHEWGVFVKEYNCNETLVKTHGLPTVMARKPVIYFHNFENNTSIKTQVDLIKNATTEPFGALDFLGNSQPHSYPAADIENDTISWNFTIVNNSIKQDNTTYSSLFYEGKINDNTNIIANITDDNILVFGKRYSVLNNTKNVTYYVKNNQDYTLSDVFVIYAKYSIMGVNEFGIRDKLECVYFGDLESGEEKTIMNTQTDSILNSTEVKNIIQNSLIEKGLTSTEANELIDSWSDWWFRPSNYGRISRVIYIIPQSEYDKLLPLSISPQPDIINRVGIYTITNLPITCKEEWDDTFPGNIITITAQDEYYLDLSLSTDKTVYEQNENVSISLMVTNPTDENISLNFTSGYNYDFKVLNEENEILYYWSYGQAFTEALMQRIIPANSTIEFLNTTWSQKDNNGTLLPAGNYSIISWIPTANNIFSNAVDIKLERNQEEKIDEIPGFEILLLMIAIISTIFFKRRKRG